MLEDAAADRGSHSDVVLGDVTYLHTDAAKKRNSVPLRLITESDRIAALGRISAETVRILTPSYVLSNHRQP